MKPDVLMVGIDLALEDIKGLAFALPHLLNFLTEDTGNGNTAQIEVYGYLVHDAERFSYSAFLHQAS